MTSRSGLAFVSSLALACTSEVGISIEIRGGELRDRIATYEVTAIAGGTCPVELGTLVRAEASPAAQVIFDAGAPIAPGPLPEGGYALAVLGRASDCTPVAFGCSALAVGSQEHVTVVLAEASWAEPVCDGRACGAGRCLPMLADGGMDGGVDASADAAFDAPVDAGMELSDAAIDAPFDPLLCTSTSDCGSEVVHDCVARRCVLRIPTVDFDDLGAGADGFRRHVAVATTIESGTVRTIHVAFMPVSGGVASAVIESMPLTRFTEDAARHTTRLSEDQGVISTEGIDIAGLGTNLHLVFTGRHMMNRARVAWVGYITDPGGENVIEPLYVADGVAPLAPVAIVTGARGSIRYVTRHRDPVTAEEVTFSVDSSFSGKTAEEIEDGPSGPGLGASGSSGEWMVIENVTGGELLFWRPDDAEALSLERRPAESSAPSLVLLDEDRYWLAYGSAGVPQLHALRCGDACDFATAPLYRPTLGTLVDRIALARSNDTTYAVTVTRTDPARLELYTLADAGDLRGPRVLAPLAAGERVHGLDVAGVPDGIVLVASIGSGAEPSRIMILRAAF
jgi:hypothetical protein